MPGRSKSRSPLPPSNYKLSLSPRRFLPPSHYAAAAGISHIRPSPTKPREHNLDLDTRSAENCGDSGEDYICPFMPVGYPSGAESTSNSSSDLNSAAQPSPEEKQPSSQRGRRQSIISDLPQLEANLLPSLRDTINRMTCSPSHTGLSASSTNASHLSVPKASGGGCSSGSPSPTWGPRTPSSTSYFNECPITEPSTHSNELSNGSEILTPRMNLPTKSSAKSELRPPTPNMFSKSPKEHLTGGPVRSARSILKQASTGAEGASGQSSVSNVRDTLHLTRFYVLKSVKRAPDPHSVPAHAPIQAQRPRSPSMIKFQHHPYASRTPSHQIPASTSARSPQTFRACRQSASLPKLNGPRTSPTSTASTTPRDATTTNPQQPIRRFFHRAQIARPRSGSGRAGEAMRRGIGAPARIHAARWHKASGSGSPSTRVLGGIKVGPHRERKSHGPHTAIPPPARRARQTHHHPRARRNPRTRLASPRTPRLNENTRMRRKYSRASTAGVALRSLGSSNALTWTGAPRGGEGTAAVSPSASKSVCRTRRTTRARRTTRSISAPHPRPRHHDLGAPAARLRRPSSAPTMSIPRPARSTVHPRPCTLNGISGPLLTPQHTAGRTRPCHLLSYLRIHKIHRWCAGLGTRPAPTLLPVSSPAPLLKQITQEGR